MPGVPIVRAGGAGDAMYLIASGEAEVEIGRGKLVVLKQGDFFGEMALLEHRRHKHDVVAKTKCRIYVLDAEALSRLARSHPEILRHIRQVAEMRATSGDAAQSEIRKRKGRTASPPPRKQDAETL
jgi:CRP-like cAMP-binding protein